MGTRDLVTETHRSDRDHHLVRQPIHHWAPAQQGFVEHWNPAQQVPQAQQTLWEAFSQKVTGLYQRCNEVINSLPRWVDVAFSVFCIGGTVICMGLSSNLCRILLLRGMHSENAPLLCYPLLYMIDSCNRHSFCKPLVQVFEWLA